MAEFQELIKNFDRIRDYMRQFFVYGYKSRSDYEGKSARTYDNERRRIESWLSGCIQSGYTQKEKHVYISVDSKTIPQNPLYAAWKSKSFTDNDILLHFFLPDLLWNVPEGMTAGQLCDAISAEYGVALDSQTVRLKLKEYEQLGILESVRQGKRLCYRLLPGPCQVPSGPDSFTSDAASARTAPNAPWALPDTPFALPDTPHPAPLTPSTWQSLLTAVTFFQEAAPFGFIGSTILDHENAENQWFSFKHHFLVHTLEDGVLAEILAAMEEHRYISFENKSSRSGTISSMSGLPLKIFVSTQTGRRYLCLYLSERRRFTNVRLDSMTKITTGEVCGSYERKQQLLLKNMPLCWGVSFGGPSRTETIYLSIFLDEEKEPHILNRLYREGRGGEILKIREHEYLYSGSFFDTNEMLAWVKTFTGRILDIQGSNAFVVAKITRDLEKMYEMYGPAADRGLAEENTVLIPDCSGSEPLSNAQEPGTTRRLPECQNSAIEAFSLADDQPLSSMEARSKKIQFSRDTAETCPFMVSAACSEQAVPRSQELFDEIYGCYYQAVRHILSQASADSITPTRMNELSIKYGYLESGLAIVPKLTSGSWPLLRKEEPAARLLQAGPEHRSPLYRSVLRNPEILLPGSLPLTCLQRSWLKAILSDRRIRLFLTDRQQQELEAWLSHAGPLFHQEDFYYFDQYLDGDDYGSLPYQEHFRTILKALSQNKALIIVYENRHGQRSTLEAAPYQLQYSSKDDKFRLCCLKYFGHSFSLNTMLNLSRIKACHLSRRAAPEQIESHTFRPIRRAAQPITIEISGERNSLERCMLHFANYEKHTQYQEDTGTWLCSIYYDLADETELLIDILSFGPVIRVLGPDGFLRQIRSRVQKQHELFYRAV